MARIYDIYDAPMEWMGTRSRRKRLLGQASGSVLEVGIGTGKNLPYYHDGVDVTGIDVSSGMLSRAKQRLVSTPVAAVLIEADVQDLPFDDDSFDTVVGTSVFCSVADPVMGMREMGRVVKPQGRILLLEHVRPRNRIFGFLADLATVLTRRLFGFRANRRTEENIAASGLEVIDVTRNGVWRTIVARAASSSSEGRTG
ncbi:MAG: class I SAM-dependent methyltransferase [Acidimicrobiia bacterium]|nr:MAG: class I SAM-dependent methyltransferase [Acidimicrobiia bacterium]